MKKLIATITLGIVLVGCKSSPQQTEYNTLYSIEVTTTGAFKGYLDTVVAGTSSTNSVPQISHAYNDFQAAILPALDAVEYSTNTLAPLNLVQESTDIINLITTAEKGAK